MKNKKYIIEVRFTNNLTGGNSTRRVVFFGGPTALEFEVRRISKHYQCYANKKEISELKVSCFEIIELKELEELRYEQQ